LENLKSNQIKKLNIIKFFEKIIFDNAKTINVIDFSSNSLEYREMEKLFSLFSKFHSLKSVCDRTKPPINWNFGNFVKFTSESP